MPSLHPWVSYDLLQIDERKILTNFFLFCWFFNLFFLTFSVCINVLSTYHLDILILAVTILDCLGERGTYMRAKEVHDSPIF